jgi:hypothetical protein
MFKTSSLAATAALALSLSFAGNAMAASTASSSSVQPPAPKTATPGPGLVCQVAKSGNYVHIQALNNGTAAVPAGDTFTFTIVGPTKKTTETKALAADLAPGKAINVTSAIKAASVKSCTPAA